MPQRAPGIEIRESVGPVRRALKFAAYDWTREMPPRKRFLAWACIMTQGYVLYSALMWSWLSPDTPTTIFFVLPRGLLGSLLVVLLYYIGMSVLDGTLASELVRKTQLEADQIAAQQIQQTLIPQQLEAIPGYDVETFYKPYRDVGGDYFDVIELAGGKTLFAVADVSGKGMAAAMLSANIQALVRSIANKETDPLAFARQINNHLSRYTPVDRFATAVFLVLHRESGEFTYVNAGHNYPILLNAGVEGSKAATLLQATGIPLGLSSDASYEVASELISPGGALLLYTDGLTDSLPGEKPEARLCEALAAPSARTINTLKSMVDPKFNEDDVTILLVKHQPLGKTD